MTWNYRVIETECEGEVTHAIHEVYYCEDGSLLGYTANPVGVVWTAGEEFGGDILDQMREALSKPVLTPQDFIFEEK